MPMPVIVLFCFCQGPRLSSAEFETPLASFDARRQKEDINDQLGAKPKKGCKSKETAGF